MIGRVAAAKRLLVLHYILGYICIILYDNWSAIFETLYEGHWWNWLAETNSSSSQKYSEDTQKNATITKLSPPEAAKEGEMRDK